METVNENSIIVAGISAKVTNPDSGSLEIGQLWQAFFDQDISDKVTDKINGCIYSVYHSYEGDNTKPYTITIGHRLKNTENIPEGIDCITIPAQNYQIFTASGKIPQSIIDTWQRVWNSNIERTYTFDFERYDERAQDPEDAIVDIYIAVK